MTSSCETIRPLGIFDGAAAPAFHNSVSQALAQNPALVIIDFQETSFIDSSGLGALVSAQKKVRSQGKKLHFCNLNAQIEMIFELTSLDQAFDIFTTLDEAQQL
ncbi:MAG: STAS domain-containing protein [Prochlorothrix sp.]|nr:STAS domain-containing protein [Prochlorothrix sp.]